MILRVPHLRVPPAWRLQAARTVAWCLLLAGWVGLGCLARSLAPGPLTAFAIIALWLLALGIAASLVGRRPMPHPMRAAAILGAACAAAAALTATTHAATAWLLVPAVLAWATLVAIASNVVRACRESVAARTTSPVTAAATGALLAWLCIGDAGDVAALVPRLVALVASAGVLLVLLVRVAPRRGGATGPCRAGLFDCSIPAWSLDDWRSPGRWPLALAAFAMLPMMCGIAWMTALCRADGASSQAMLGMHFAAMFAPAVLATRLRSRVIAMHAPGLCAALLVTGAIGLSCAPGGTGWWMLSVAHGAAWSLAWSARLSVTARRRSSRARLAAAVSNALVCVAIGATVATIGIAAFADWHLALGAMAAASTLVVLVQRGLIRLRSTLLATTLRTATRID